MVLIFDVCRLSLAASSTNYGPTAPYYGLRTVHKPNQIFSGENRIDLKLCYVGPVILIYFLFFLSRTYFGYPTN